LILNTKSTITGTSALRYRTNFIQLSVELVSGIAFWLIGIFQKLLVQNLEKLNIHYGQGSQGIDQSGHLETSWFASFSDRGDRDSCWKKTVAKVG
jgi:hypothetical protein